MGADKASLLVQGEPQAARIVRLLAEKGIATTTLGREPVIGASFLPDEEEFAGPVSALRRFRPTADLVFVASCDLPRFDPRLVDTLTERLGEADAAVPFVCGFRQPLCALYRGSLFSRIGEGDCAMSLLEGLNVRLVDDEELRSSGIDPLSTQGANTPEELQEALSL